MFSLHFNMSHIVPVSGSYQALTALYGSSFLGCFGNIGPNAGVLYQTNKPIPSNTMNINIAASAGDCGDSNEPLSQFESKSREFGTILGNKLDSFSREHSIDAVVSTGGCPNIGDWVTQEVKNSNSNAYLVAIYPNNGTEPLDTNNVPEFLKQYDMIFYTDMNLALRSVLVGTFCDVLLGLHGGFGTSMEVSAAADSKKVIALYDIGSITGVSKFGADFLKDINYRNGYRTFFRNSDPDNLITRALVEYRVKKEGVGDDLTAVVAYHNEYNNTSGERIQSLLFNVRRAGEPATFYHRGESPDKIILPLTQTLIVAKPQDVLNYLQSIAYSKILSTRNMEEPHMLKIINRQPEESLVLTKRLNDALENGNTRVFWSRTF